MDNNFINLTSPDEIIISSATYEQCCIDFIKYLQSNGYDVTGIKKAVTHQDKSFDCFFVLNGKMVMVINYKGITAVYDMRNMPNPQKRWVSIAKDHIDNECIDTFWAVNNNKHYMFCVNNNIQKDDNNCTITINRVLLPDIGEGGPIELQVRSI